MKPIAWVGSLEGGDMVDIHLCTGESILLSIATLRQKPDFAALGEEILHPRTDGGSVYWPDGPRLAYGEILHLLAEGGDD